MKDYFDLQVLLGENKLEPAQLSRAIEATFARRKMDLPSSIPMGLSDAFAADGARLAQWAAFLKKNRLEATSLVSVVTRLRGTLMGNSN